MLNHFLKEIRRPDHPLESSKTPFLRQVALVFIIAIHLSSGSGFGEEWPSHNLSYMRRKILPSSPLLPVRQMDPTDKHAVSTCKKILLMSLAEKDIFSRIVKARKSIECTIKAYSMTIGKPGRRMDFGREDLPTSCLRFENPKTDDSAFKVRLIVLGWECIIDTHVSILSAVTGFRTQLIAKDFTNGCTNIRKPSPSDDIIHWLQLKGAWMNCQLKYLLYLRLLANVSNPVQGIRALMPVRTISDWGKSPPREVSSNDTEYPHALIIADKNIICAQKKLIIINNQTAFNLNAILLQIVADHIQSNCVKPSLPYKVSLDIGVGDVLTAPTWPSPNQNQSFLYPHSQNDICVMVRRLQPVRRSVLETFSPVMWAFIAITWLSFFGANRLVERKVKMDLQWKPLISFLATFLSVFRFMMLSAFESTFSSFLTVPGEPDQPQTLQEVTDSVNRTYGLHNLDYALAAVKSSDVAWSLLDKLIGPVTATALFDLLSNGGAGLIYSRFNLEAMLKFSRSVKRNGQALTHIVPQCLVAPAYQMFLIRRGWLLGDKISGMVQRLVEGGVLKKLRSAYLHQMRTKGKFVAVLNSVEGEATALGVEDIWEPGVFLAAGLGLAAGVFAAEVGVARWRRATAPGSDARTPGAEATRSPATPPSADFVLD